MDRKRVKDLAGQRDRLISKLLGRLEDKVKTAQRSLLRTVLEDFVDGLEKDDAGNIKNTIGNKRRFGMFDKIFNRFAQDKGLEVVKTLAEGVGSVINFNHKYYSAFAQPAQLAPIQTQVKESLEAWLGMTERGAIKPNGYLDTLIKSDTVKNSIRNLISKSVYSQGGYNDLKKNLGDFIEGGKEQTGALNRYYRNFAFDTYSIADRTAGKITADKLKFNYAIYEGGLIETSREFCEEHNGNVYSRDEIKEFYPEKAIPPNYDPFTDMGGYGCRHHWNWVPDEVAFSMRPELKNAAPPKTAEPPKVETKGFKPAETKEDATKYAKETFKLKDFEQFGRVTKAVDFSAYSLDLANNVNNKLTELIKKYNTPLLSIGGDVRNSGGFGMASLLGRSVHYNPAKMNDVEAYIKSRTNAQQTNYYTTTDEENIKFHTIVHEYGHLVAAPPRLRDLAKSNAALKPVLKEFDAIEKEFRTKATPEEKKEIGGYAQENDAELFAEMFTNYELSKSPSKWSVKMMDWYNKNKKIIDSANKPPKVKYVE